jgi:glycine/D-amino acid oxidase-like deaminating enzyme
MNVAIVGGGIMGLCTAKALVERGHEVTVFEQHRPGNPYGSTTGRTRIVRQAYPDQFYTEILLKGHDLWYELETQTGQKLVHQVGLLYVGPQREAEILNELDALENLGVPYRVYTSKDVRAVHPQMVLGPDEIGIMTLNAGWADAPAVLSTLQKFVEDRGVRVVQKRVTRLDPADLSDLSDGPGSGKKFDRVVVTAGPWVMKFFDVPLRVTLQTIAYVGLETQGPVWIEGFGGHLYGFPSEPGSKSTKIGYHTLGPEIDPDSVDRIPQADALAAIEECARRRFVGSAAQAEVVEPSACVYTVSENDDFKIGWFDDATLVASPCSGHGFKFGPWMGRFLADVLEENEDVRNWPRFALSFS